MKGYFLSAATEKVCEHKLNIFNTMNLRIEKNLQKNRTGWQKQISNLTVFNLEKSQTVDLFNLV